MHIQKNQTFLRESVAEQTRTILIVEDDVAVGHFLVAAITQETPHYAYVVTNGSQALQACATDTIDLVILDYSLPHMNGIEFYDALHALQGANSPPVMMVSARLPIGELTKRNLPSLRKPLELQTFLDAIERMLQ